MKSTVDTGQRVGTANSEMKMSFFSLRHAGEGVFLYDATRGREARENNMAKHKERKRLSKWNKADNESEHSRMGDARESARMSNARAFAGYDRDHDHACA